MSDVFISYAREDRAWVEIFAAALERAGLSVWWDIRNRPGLSFDDQIEQALEACKAVVVVWSAASLGSRWVKAEAGVALDRNILIPVLKDTVAPPLVFRQLHCANLSGWTGAPHPEFDDLVRELARLAGHPPELTTMAAAPPLPVTALPDDEATLFQPRALQAGDIVGHYRIVAPLGQGGSGAIYEACNIHNEHERVALKILQPDIPDRDRFLDFLRDEANALQRVRNDAVVQYRTFGRIPDSDEFFLVIEYVEGPTLGAALRAAPIPVEALRRLAVRVCAGLEAAHAQGVIHRDLSPDNIVLPGGDTDRAIIIDFGIARNGAFDPLGGSFAGKLSYAAPEQFDGNPELIGPWTDLYSLGLVLAAAASGRKLPMGNDMASAIALRHAVPDLASVPSELRAPLAELLKPQPALRVRSAKEAAAMFADRAFAPMLPVAPRVIREPDTRVGTRNGFQWMVPAVATLVVFAALAAGTYWFVNRGDGTPRSVEAAAAPQAEQQTPAPSRGESGPLPGAPVGAPPVSAPEPSPPASNPQPAPVEPQPTPSPTPSEPEPAPVPPKPAPKPAPVPAPSAPAGLDARLTKLVAEAKKVTAKAEKAANDALPSVAKAEAVAAEALNAEASAQQATMKARNYAKQACAPNPPADLRCPPVVAGQDHFAGQYSCTDTSQCTVSQYYVLTEATGTIDEGRWEADVLKEGCITRGGAVEYCGAYNGAMGRSGPGVYYAASLTIAADWTGPNPSDGHFCFDFSKKQDGSSRLCGELSDPLRRIGEYKDANGQVDRGTFNDLSLALGVTSPSASNYSITGEFGQSDVKGTMSYEDGRRFIGRIAYANVGYNPLEGVLYAADGTILQQGKWKDGMLVENYGAAH